MSTQRIVIIITVLVLLLIGTLFLNNQSGDSIAVVESLKEPYSEVEADESIDLEIVEQTHNQPSARILDENLEEIHQCAERMSVPSFQLIQAGDSIEEVFRVAKNIYPLNTHIDLENIHFIDQRGEELRFQIIDEKESRFFKVDHEGLPIRIDTPELFLNMNSKDQKAALIREYRHPKFSQQTLKLSSKESPLAIEALIENDQVKELQIFKRGPQGHSSLACHKESGSEFRCKCL